ncbi:MAG: carboxypeptidase-like regulatory domain-containing protein [Marinifilaceae bacterium]
MNASDRMKLESFNETEKVLDENTAIYEADQATNDLKTIFSKQLRVLEKLSQIMKTPIEWLTQEKREIKKKLLKKAYPLSVGLVRFANATNNKKMLEEVKSTKSDLRKLSIVELINSSQNLIRISNENIAELANYKITPETITDFSTDVDALEENRTNKIRILKDKKEAGTEFKTTKREINLLLKNELDWSIEGYRSEHPEFVNHYFAARQASRTHYRPNAVLGYVTDEESGNSITRGTVSVEGLELSTDVSPNGTFRFKTFPEGEYTLRITNMNYKTLLVPIRCFASEQCKLHVKMQPDPLAKPHIEEETN